MTTLKKIAKESKEVYQDTIKYMIGIEDLQKKLNEQYDNDLITETYYNNEIKEYRDKTEKDIKQRVRDIRLKISTSQEFELNKLKEKEKPITQDMLAELILLAELNPDKETLIEYKEKYKDTPLALKKIEKIGQNENIQFSTEELSEREKLQDQFKKIDNDLQYLEFMSFGIGNSITDLSKGMTLELTAERLEAIEAE